MKILVCGDRNWDDIEFILNVLSQFDPNTTTLVHGACRGADNIAGAIGEELGFCVKSYPANWTMYDKQAGPIRNSQMLKCEHVENDPIDLCIAFHDNIARSKGTKDMVTKCKKAHIDVNVYHHDN